MTAAAARAACEEGEVCNEEGLCALDTPSCLEILKCAEPCPAGDTPCVAACASEEDHSTLASPTTTSSAWRSAPGRTQASRSIASAATAPAETPTRCA